MLEYICDMLCLVRHQSPDEIRPRLCWKPRDHVHDLSNDSMQLLNVYTVVSDSLGMIKGQLTTQEKVSLLDDLLVDSRLVLRCQLVRRDDPADLVDGTAQSATGDEFGQISVHERLADAERPAHPLQGERLVRLEQLRVRLDSHFSDVVSGVRGEDGVGD